MSLRARVCAALVAVGCAAPPSADAPRPAPSASHGGVLVELESHTGELVVHASGELHFHALAGDDLSRAGVTITLADTERRSHTIAMRYAGDVQGFVGRMDRGTPAPGHAEVLLVDHGHATRASVRTRRLPRGEHDGSVVSTGTQVIEVVVEGDGSTRAYLAGDRRHDAVLTVGIPDERGALHPCTLEWDRERRCYVGRIEGIVPQPGPLEVIVEREGHEEVARGSLVSVGVAPPTALPSGLRLELPVLGSHLPAVISVPPTEHAGDGG